MCKIVNFKISSIDSLGQGVSKENAEIIFIPKTLPGEEGLTRIIGKKKSVSFGVLESLTLESPDRIPSECPHFAKCGGCDYLHTSYEQELEIKKRAILDIFERQSKISISSKLQIIQAKDRFGYRNRIQLHYDKKSRKLGFFNKKTKSILEVPSCMVPSPEVKECLEQLYENQSWLERVKDHSAKGHIEIYQRAGELKLSINQRYAHEGFTQVNQDMNDKLLKLVATQIKGMEFKHKLAIDLFGGSGNLSASLEVETLVIDATPSKYIKLTQKQQSYLEIDLYKDNHLDLLKKSIPREIDLLLIDPPRSGFKELDKTIQAFNPAQIIYVSCNPQTLGRDLKNLPSNYHISHLFLIDFFPGTKHFESMAFIQKKD